MENLRQVVINELRACSRRRGTTIEDAFTEYDPKETGSMTYSNFRKVLSSLGFWFDEAKLSSTITSYTDGSLFRYKDFISNARPVPLQSPISDRTLIKFGLALKARSVGLRDCLAQADPLHTGRVSVFNFMRAWKGEEMALKEICDAYKLPTCNEVDYFRLAKDIDRLLANRTEAVTPVVPAALPVCFRKVVETIKSSSVDPLGSFLLIDKLKKNRITAQQFAQELETFRVVLSPPEWQELVKAFSDEDGVDYRKFHDEYKKELENLPRNHTKVLEDVKISTILENLAVTYRNRHSQLEQSLRDADTRNIGTIPTFRFFRALGLSQFNISQRDKTAMEQEFRIDDTTIDYERFLAALAPPASAPVPDVRNRLKEFLHTRFIPLRPLLERFDSKRSGFLTIADLLIALRTISFDISPAEHQRLKQIYGISSNPNIDIADFCYGIDYSPTPAIPPSTEPPAALVKPVYANKPARATPPGDILAILNRVAIAVADLRIELFTDFRGMDPLRQGVVPVFRFRNHLTNMGIQAFDVDRLISHYQASNGVDWSAFLDQLKAFGKATKERMDLSFATKQLLMFIKTQVLAHQVSIESLFYRYDSSRTCRVLKSRVPGILSAIGLRVSADQITSLCDDFADPKLPEYVGYKAMVDYIDSLHVSDDELKSVEVSTSSATIDRDIASMLNTFREQLIARHRAPADGFRGCPAGPIAPQQFRDGLLALGLYLREADLQKLLRKYRCNMHADVDWCAFCRDIGSSKTLDGGY